MFTLRACSTAVFSGAIALGLAGCVADSRRPARSESAFALEPGATIEVGSKAVAVPFESYREQFTGGDSIVIEHVFAPLAQWQPGDTLVVRGRYVLASQPTAVLALYVTSRGGGGPTATRQRKLVRQGAGEFELTCEIPPGGGEPHVTFYPGSVGSALGGVYFKPAGP